ncbi:MAG: DUF2184 domain-containing protein, partial [Candidatus Pacearchaeota archaeon]|nr:DUF2184 domain-containing protein [Candidatus Pacearchaeota archaeon]
ALNQEFQKIGLMDRVKASLNDGTFLHVIRGLEDAVPAPIMGRALEYAVTRAMYLITTYVIWREVFPIDKDMPDGADTKKFTIMNAAGMAEWYRGGGKHPNVAIGAREVSIAFHTITTSFSIDWLEMIASTYAGVNTEAEKARACMEHLDRKVEDIVFAGDATMDRPPLIDHPNITSGNMPTGTWSTATAAEIIADCQYGITQIVSQCANDDNFQPMLVDIMVSPTNHRIVTSKQANDFNNETIEGVLRTLDGKFGRFINSPKHGSIDSGTNATFGVFNDIDTLCVSLSMDRRRMPPNDMGYLIEQPMATKIGRLHVKHPLRFWQGANA